MGERVETGIWGIGLDVGVLGFGALSLRKENRPVFLALFALVPEKDTDTNGWS